MFDELARASAGGRADYAGLSHARLDAEQDLFWPVPARRPTRHPADVPRPLPDARRSRPTDPRRPPRPGDDLRRDAPLFLITGRVLAHYQSGAQTRRVPELVRSARHPYVEIHPLLADRLRDHRRATWCSSTPSAAWASSRARLTDAVRTDTVFLPFHWSGVGSANRLTTDATDPDLGHARVQGVRRRRAPLDRLRPTCSTTSSLLEVS